MILFSCGPSKKNADANGYVVPRIDSLEGMFFYEGNVPYKCFTRNDQVERSNSVILFDEQISTYGVERLYKKGVFYFTYPSLISKYIKQNRVSLAQNKNSIQKFEKDLNFLVHTDDSAYNSTLYYDSSKVLSFKKFYAKIYYYRLGKLQQLIPDTKNYQCCYSNAESNTETMFITDIREVKVY